jgi:hypothetical protein
MLTVGGAMALACAALVTVATSPARPPRPPEIRVWLDPRTVGRGEQVFVFMMVKNPSAKDIIVRHPMYATNAVSMRVRLPSGDEVVVKSAVFVPSHGPVEQGMLIPRKASQRFEIDLTQRHVSPTPALPLDVAGRYTVRVDYEWRAGELWRSPPLTLTVR